MPTVLELRKQKADKVVAAKAALDDPTKYAELKGEIDSIDTAIKDAVAEELAATQRRAEVEAWDKELKAVLPRKADPNGPANLGKEPAIPKDHDAKPYRSFGEQLCAVANYYRKGVYDPRQEAVDQLSVASGGSAASNPADGGFLIQSDFVNELTGKMFEGGEFLSRVRKIPISANSNSLTMNVIDETSRATGSRWGGVQLYWGGEGDTATAKKPKIREMKLSLGKLLGLWYATDELLTDASAMESIAQTAFQEEFTFVLEDAMFRGDGVGKPQGILNANALVSITKETGQAAATIVFENILKMFSAMKPANYRNAAWFVNVDCLKQLMQMTMTIGTSGVPVWLPPGALTASPYGMLMGRPVIPVEYCSTLGTVGDIVLADWSQYLVIDKGPMQSASSIHVRFLTDETTFRFMYRVNGQCLWNSALTPYKGSQTQGPFVALATRS